MTPWRCVLVGSESLLIQCAQILAQQGHQVVAVVSTRPEIKRFAAEHGMRVLRDVEGLLAATDLQPFDVLFSITNLTVLPPAVLALPQRHAINFHDGPLPHYAGLNTPVWAMLNGARQHGITWHLMTDGVDCGDVLAQRLFDIADDETALTLNTKCFEAGIDSFGDMVAGLATGALQPQPQGAGERRYFGRKDRPAAACTIDWLQPAAEIAAVVRALDFGTYANPVGAAKAAASGLSVVVSGVELVATASGLAPGRIVGIDAQAITVATGDGDLRLTRLADSDGVDLSPTQAAQRLGLTAGNAFDALDAGTRQRLGIVNSQVCVHEGFWLRRLEKQTPVELPGVNRSLQAAPARWEQLDAPLPAGAGAASAVAAVVALVARLCDKATFELGHGDASLHQLLRGTLDVFAAQVPLRAEVNFLLGFDALLAGLGAERAELQRRGTYAADLVARAPELRAQATKRDLRVQPVAVLDVDRLDEARALPGSELTIATDGRVTRWIFDATRLGTEAVLRFQGQFATLLTAALAAPGRPLGQLPLLDDVQRDQVLEQWNATAAPWRADACVHRLIAEQTARSPDAPAVTCEEQTLSYRELDQRSNQLARHLAALGVGPDVLVGLSMERSVEMMVALVAVHKAGGAYVPLDPAYPADRIAYMLEDSKVPVLLTQQRLRDDLPGHRANVVCVDSDWSTIATLSADAFDGGAEPQHLAYVIYTSGSTGKPKGVMVEHRNVVNFFAGMDAHLGGDAVGTWLAVTSLSFDISVLELCWTLARGYHVVIAADADRGHTGPTRGPAAARPLDFSLFYFSSDESESTRDKYRLLIEGSKFGDQHGFAAVWTPERHFNAFGGLYPNPAVTGAAIATITERVQIRAGSVVLPLHHPLRVAEEWSVVDNLSNGRVGISFASGWHPNDFALRPQNFADAKNVMLRDIDVVRRLWRGETIEFDGPLGKPVSLRVLPRPVQPELPYWVTSAGNPETFKAAGRIGARVLTHLLGQTVAELKDKLAAYRQDWREAGHPGEGYVSLMLHSFVGPDDAKVRETVRQPLIEYLRSSLNLVKQYAWTFPAFKRREGMDTAPDAVDLTTLANDEMDALLEHSFERYYETSGLFGTPDSCLAMIDAIKSIGVDDVACLIDFGVSSDAVLAHLPYLNQLRRAATPRPSAPAAQTLPALMQRHRVTHLQCTPSMARMLMMDGEAAPGLSALRRMMVGGEAFPPSLAHDLGELVGGQLMNMYGPTETTIWSAVQAVPRDAGSGGSMIPLGRPLANQEIYVLDTRQQPLPPGVPGELVIGGRGVVRGYLHRDDLTAERFLPHPLRGAQGGRVYRTGDLARQRDDGTLEFLGRLDHQVKVRGYRIELGEIEATLLAHPALREAVVMAREDVPGDTRLVAYFAARGSGLPSTGELREHLRARLPDYMVPSHFVLLPALPQTPNGKIDRHALPAPDLAPVAAASAAFVAPDSELQEQIAGIWRDVLKLPQVGIRDNFFDIGGHSLLAVQAHRRLRETLQRNLSITDIFRFPTIATLAAYLDQAPGADGAASQRGVDRAAGRRAAMQRRGVRPSVTADKPN